jgi:hypothetical protein
MSVRFPPCVLAVIFMLVGVVSAYAAPLVAPSSPTLATGALNSIVNFAALGLAISGPSGTSPITRSSLEPGSEGILTANALPVIGDVTGAVGLANGRRTGNHFTTDQRTALAAELLGGNSGSRNRVAAPVLVVRPGTIPANP